MNQPPENTPIAAIILAAGKSTRMKSKTPKPLHPICGLPMTQHVVRACRAAGVARVVVVVGHEADKVQAGLGTENEYALQEIPRGTGDAVKAAQPLFTNWKGTILVLAGDTPLLRPESLRGIIAHQQSSEVAATMLTAVLDNPAGYGRILRDGSGNVVGIVEHKDASEVQRAIKEWNPSIYAFNSEALWTALDEVKPNNVQGEYYLTDTVGILNQMGHRIAAIPVENPSDVIGVNNRVELAEVASVLQSRILRDLMLSGVTIADPSNTYIEADVEIGQDSVVEPYSFLHSGTRIGEDCIIGPFTTITQSTIGNRCQIRSSQVVESEISDDVRVGPYANLRKGTRLGNKVKIGDFVETKNAVFGESAQASHLSYIGDAEVGCGVNIGAGTITCNYDGYFKYKTIIGNHAFIGSNSTLVAPVHIGERAMTTAGSVITADVDSDGMAFGRARQETKIGRAAQFRTQQSERKAAGDKPEGAL